MQEPQPEGEIALGVDDMAEDSGNYRLKRWIALMVLVLLALIIGWSVIHARSVAAAKRNAQNVVRAIPVSASPAVLGDMNLTLSALGTVTSMDSVILKSRVDGQLVRFPIQEGQVVHKGDLIAEIDPRPFQVQLMQAEGQKAKDEASFKNAARDLERFQTLFEQGILAKQQLDAQRSSVDQFEAVLKADQAQVESAKLNLVYSRITAPLTGKVGLRLVDPGNMVRAADPNGLCVINPVQPITVVFTIPADSISQVIAHNEKGTPLPVEAFDRDLKNRLATGSVLAIDNQVDPATGTVRIKAVFENQDQALFPNQFVNVRLLVTTLKGVVIVPTAALQRSPDGPFLYRIKPDHTVEMVPVEIQATDGDHTSIKKGLASGDMIVTDGLERLRPGSLVAEASPQGAQPHAKAHP